MMQITKVDSKRVHWLVPSLFENPETLAAYLRRYAPAGEYRIEGETVYATLQALEAAEAGFARELEASREGAMLHA